MTEASNGQANSSSVEIDEEASAILKRLGKDDRVRLVSHAIRAAGGTPCVITVSALAAALADEAADQSHVSVPVPQMETVGSGPDHSPSAAGLILGAGLLVAIGCAVTLAALTIPSVVHDDASRVLITLAMLGLALTLFGAIGLAYSRRSPGRDSSPSHWLDLSRLAAGAQEQRPASTFTLATGDDGTAAASDKQSEASSYHQAEVRAAFRAGWLMAQLYKEHRPPQVHEDRLSSVNELTPPQIKHLRLLELTRQLEIVGGPADAHMLQAVQDAADPLAGEFGNGDYRSAQWHLHLQLLADLWQIDLRLGCAYELGRSLTDVAWPPPRSGSSAARPASMPDLSDFLTQLNWRRLLVLDRWLANLSYDLGRDRVTAVMASLQNWSDYLETMRTARKQQPYDLEMLQLSLQEQGQLWHDLLAGICDPSALPRIGAAARGRDASLGWASTWLPPEKSAARLRRWRLPRR